MTKAEQTVGAPDSDDAGKAEEAPAAGGAPGPGGTVGSGVTVGPTGPVASAADGVAGPAGTRARAAADGAAGSEGAGRPDRAGGADDAAGSDDNRGAARGEASGETGEPGGTGGPDEAGDGEPPRGKRRIVVLLAVAALAYVLDLVSKMIVVAKLEHREPIELIGHYLQLDAVRNAGAAFGIGEAFTAVFGLIAMTVIVVIARIARKLYSLPWAIALGMLLGGALGNLTDRIFRSPGVFQGEVVDFIAPAHFAVFNLADSSIVCGGFLIVLLSFRGSAPDGSVQRD